MQPWNFMCKYDRRLDFKRSYLACNQKLHFPANSTKHIIALSEESGKSRDAGKRGNCPLPFQKQQPFYKIIIDSFMVY